MDSGELAVASYYLGVAHPTGYPLYTLLGRLFTLLPLGDVAYRLNLMSAFFGAAAAALLSATIWLLLVNRFSANTRVGLLASTLGGLVFAYSPAFWTQSIIAEVYSLHILFTSAVIFLLFLLQYSDPNSRPLYFVAVTFLAGLAFSHHSTAVLLFPAVGYYLLTFGARKYVLSVRWLSAGIAAFLSGLSPYLLLVVRNNKAPEANWGGIDSLASFLDHITGAVYRPLLLSPLDADVFQRIAAAAKLLLEQYGWLGFVAAIVGLWYISLVDRKLLAFWVVLFFSVFVFTINYSARDSEVHLLPIYLIVAMAIGNGAAFGAAALEDLTSPSNAVKAPRRSNRRKQSRELSGFKGPLYVAVFVLCLLWVGSSANVTAAKVDLTKDREAYDYATTTLDTLPLGALILTNDDSHTFSLWYLQYVIGHRRDVVVVDNRLLNWNWYQRNLKALYPSVRLEEVSGTASQRVQKLVQNNIGDKLIFSAYRPTALSTEDAGPPFKVTQ